MVIVLELLIMKTFSGCKDSEFSDIIATFVPKISLFAGKNVFSR